VIGILVVALLAPFAGATADTLGCYVRTSQALALGDHYVYGTAKEIWEETNGIPGLQRADSPCIDGESLPRDLCVIHSENGALVACLSAFPTTLA